MCGITGFWDTRSQYRKQEAEALGEKMAYAIKERGPDSSGLWFEEVTGLLFAHRRLAIQDLSPQGHQPMHSPSKRFTTIYNGEIFNAPEIQQSLVEKGYTFRGHSDTEVMLAAFEEWGIQASVEKFIGMFAIVLWDQKVKKLYLIRDRLGIKPLYWGWQKGVLFFGSQLKSFYPHPAWEGVISKEALISFFRFAYVPAPLSIYEGIQKLEPGAILEISRDGTTQQHTYWSMKTAYEAGKENPFSGTIEDARADLDLLLKDAVKKRLLSDVPVGAFLSGGVDSSLVVALMQNQSSQSVKTFSIGFHENLYNEAHYAKDVAKHLGTEHHELYVTSKDAQAVIPHLSDWYDEPFADSSQIPTYLVSKLAREYVAVSLSGDGGDEFFAGYTRYFVGERLWRGAEKIPPFFRKNLSSLVKNIPSSFWNGIETIAPKSFCPKHLADKALKLSCLLNQESLGGYYRSLVSQWDEPTSLVVGGRESFPGVWNALKDEDYVGTMQFLDSVTYLPDDILAKVDRASMAVSLEARVPLLDHRVVEFSWRLPLEMKVYHGQGKRILRDVLYQYVPKKLIERPKMGFGIPVGEWMRTDLKEWAESLLSPSALSQSGLLNIEPIRKRWAEHLLGKRDWQYSLWAVLMFQAWYEKTVVKRS
jgi:asparagine synthase (glutamine-hydrolysing)